MHAELHTRSETARRLPVVSLLLALACVGSMLLPNASLLLIYSPDALPSRPWCVLTSHLVHWSWSHLFWDVGTFVLVGVWCELRDRRLFLLTLAISALAVPPLVMIAHPQLAGYAGLSGLDVALCALLITEVALSNWRAFSSLARAGLVAAGAVLVGKISFEIATMRLLFVQDFGGDFVPVPLAHLIGAVCGASIALIFGARLCSAGAASPLPPASDDH